MITFETREKFFLGNNYHRLCVIHAPPPIFLPLPPPEKKATCLCAYVSSLLQEEEETNRPTPIIATGWKTIRANYRDDNERDI